VFLQQEVLVDVVDVGHVVWLRNLPDDHVTKVAARDETLTVVIGRDGRHLAAVRLVDDVLQATGLRVIAADTTVAPAYVNIAYRNTSDHIRLQCVHFIAQSDHARIRPITS